MNGASLSTLAVLAALVVAWLVLSAWSERVIARQAPPIKPAVVRFAGFDPTLASRATARRQQADALRREADRLRLRAGAVDSGSASSAACPVLQMRVR